MILTKEFNLEEAKAGAILQTRDGKAVNILKWDALGDKPIVALIAGAVACNYYENGKATFLPGKDADDLVIVESLTEFQEAVLTMCYGNSSTPSDFVNRKEEIDNLYSIAYNEGFKAGCNSVSLISNPPPKFREAATLEYVIDCYSKKAKSSTTQADESFYNDIVDKLIKIKLRFQAL